MPCLLLAQTLQHRYSFTSDASDSVGTANGTLVGSAVIQNGAVALPGGTTSGQTTCSYVSLPNGIVQSDTSVTVETWLTDNAGSTWAEAWCFGESTAGPGNPPGNGTYYFGLIPHSGPGDLRVAFNNSLSEIDVIEAGTPLPTNVEEYVVVTYDAPSSNAVLYLNGVKVASAVVPPDHAPSVMGNTYNDWLGRDQFGGDATFTGSIDELRIWNAAVSPLYLALSALAGPDVLVTNLTPTLVNVSVSNTTMIGSQTQPATVSANFSQLSNAPVTGAATNWTSSDTNILTVDASGLITALTRGNATVSATVGGVKGTSASITVALLQPSIVQEPLPLTRYVGESAVFTVVAFGGQLSYQWSKGTNVITSATNATLTLTDVVLGDAGNYSVLVTNALGSTNSTAAALAVLAPTLVHRWSFNTDANDSVGGANGTLMGAAFLDGAGNVQFPNEGTTSGSGDPPYVALPDGLLTNLNSLTIEVWATDTAGLTWAEIYSFGDSTAGPGLANAGTNYIGLVPHSGPGDMRAAFKLQAEQDVTWPSTTLPLNVEEYITLTYDAVSTTARLYLNGVQVGINTNVTITPASLGNTFNNWIARDQWSGDASFVGSVDELRIWDSPISLVYQALTIVGGPDLLITNTTPTSLTVTITNTTMIGGQSQQATLQGNFPQLSNVPLPGLAAAWTSSNPKVVTVNSSGLVTAIGSGTATVSATVGGLTQAGTAITVSVTQPILTQAPAPLSLYVGQSAVFSVAAVGGQLSYQWSQGSTPIPGATNTTLTLSDVVLSDAAVYTVTITNAAGHTNATANLTVLEPALAHRWTFDTDASDSIGGANGTLMGNAFISNNAVQLPDTNTTSLSANPSFVQFPNGILTNLNSITIEVWVTDNGPKTWAEIYSFGGSTNGPNNNADGTNYIGLVPTSADGDMRAGFKILNEQDVVWPATTMPTNEEEDVVLTYDNTTTTATLYLNGVQVAVNHNITVKPSDLGNTYNNYLGRDQFNDDIFHGSVDELRIYAGPLTPTDIVNNHLSGPESLVSPGGGDQFKIGLTRSGSSFVLTWPLGVLLQAPTLSGPWTTNSAAVSPFTVVPATNGDQFYKIQLRP